MEGVFGVPKRFVKRESAGMTLIIEKVTDGFLVDGELLYIIRFMPELSRPFTVAEVSIGGPFDL